MSRRVRATRLIPVKAQWVSVVPRGAARKVWKILKSEDGGGDSMTKLSELVELLAQKAALEGEIGEARKGLSEFEVSLAEKGLVREQVHTLVFGEKFDAARAEAWAKQSGFTVHKSEMEDGAPTLTVAEKLEDGADLSTIELEPGVVAVAVKAASLSQKAQDVLGALDTAREALVASIREGDPTAGALAGIVRKFETDLGLEAGMKTNEELAQKIEELQTKLAEQVVKTEALEASAAEAKKVDEAKKAEAAEAAKKAEELKAEETRKAEEQKAAEMVTKADVQSIIERLDRVEKAIVPGRRSASETHVLESGIHQTSKGSGVFDSAFGWGRHARA